MLSRIKSVICSLLFLTIVTVLVSCESNFRDVQKIYAFDFMPSAEADSITLKYTDSGYIKAVLVGEKMKDFASVNYPFTEFPKGIHLTLFDKKGKKTFITSNYAIQYKKTELIDLQGNVVITNEENQRLETEQLYFDQKNSWFYTEEKYKFSAPRGVSYGEGVDFDKDFKIMNTKKFSGQMEQTQ